MQQARGERQPLLPAAGQRAGELIRARRQAEMVERLARPSRAHRFTPYIRAMKSRFSRIVQVFPEREALRHVADFALDRLGFA